MVGQPTDRSRSSTQLPDRDRPLVAPQASIHSSSSPALARPAGHFVVDVATVRSSMTRHRSAMITSCWICSLHALGSARRCPPHPTSSVGRWLLRSTSLEPVEQWLVVLPFPGAAATSSGLPASRRTSQACLPRSSLPSSMVAAAAAAGSVWPTTCEITENVIRRIGYVPGSQRQRRPQRGSRAAQAGHDTTSTVFGDGADQNLTDRRHQPSRQIRRREAHRSGHDHGSTSLRSGRQARDRRSTVAPTTGSCSPIRMNANRVSRNVTICQTDVPAAVCPTRRSRRPPADDEARHDSGEDARPLEPVGRQEGRMGTTSDSATSTSGFDRRSNTKDAKSDRGPMSVPPTAATRKSTAAGRGASQRRRH